MGQRSFLEVLSSGQLIIADGGLGSTLRSLNLTEADYRGEEFSKCHHSMYGNCGILSLTQKQHVLEIQKEFILAGSDIIQTNTFCSNSIDQKCFYSIDDDNVVFRMNRSSAELANIACNEVGKQISKHAFVAGSIGPTCSAISIPKFKQVDPGTLISAYCNQVHGLLAGGVDLFMIESAMDVLNIRAAIYAVHKAAEERHEDVLPIIISAGVISGSNGILSGQSWLLFVQIFSSYPNVVSIGQNCGDNTVYNKSASIIQFHNDTSLPLIFCPSAGLPTKNGTYELSPSDFGNGMYYLLSLGKLNIIGGCCGITPEHITELASHISKDSICTRAIEFWSIDKAILRTLNGDKFILNLDVEGSSSNNDSLARAVVEDLVMSKDWKDKRNRTLFYVTINTKSQAHLVSQILLTKQIMKRDPYIIFMATDKYIAEEFLIRCPCEAIVDLSVNSEHISFPPKLLIHWVHVFGLKFYIPEDNEISNSLYKEASIFYKQ